MSAHDVTRSPGQGNTNPARMRSRRWCYTYNNYNVDDVGTLARLFSDEKFFVQGEEVGAEGTPHLQGYVEFKNPKDLSALKKINNKIHWEKAIANRKANIAYCTKENNAQLGGIDPCTERFVASDAFKKKCIDESFERYKNKNNIKIDFDFAEAFGNFMY